MSDAMNLDEIEKAATDCIEEVIRHPKLPIGWADDVDEVLLEHDTKLLRMLDPATVLELVRLARIGEATERKRNVPPQWPDGKTMEYPEDNAV